MGDGMAEAKSLWKLIRGQFSGWFGVSVADGCLIVSYVKGNAPAVPEKVGEWPVRLRCYGEPPPRPAAS
jgi:hypothetical protein